MDNNKKQVKITMSDKTSAVGLADALQHGGEIEGKAKIILTDERTGKRKIVEHKNLVTNAVKRIFQYNWLMNADASAILPMKKLFGGVLCFQNTFQDPTADTVYCPNEGENPMIACAGDLAHATTNPYRGNPNALASSIASDLSSMTQVWEWQTLQGVGTIGSVALTSAVCGNMGLKPIDDEFCPINTAANISSDAYMFTDENQTSTQVNKWTVDTARKRPMWIDTNNPRFGYTVAVIQTQGVSTILYQKLVAIKMEQTFLKTAMFSQINEYKEVERTVLLENISNTDPAASLDDLTWYTIVDDDTHVYVVRAYEYNFPDPSLGHESHIVGWKISKSDWGVQSFDYNVQPVIDEKFSSGGINTWGDDGRGNNNIADCWFKQNGLPFDNGQLLGNWHYGGGLMWFKITDTPTVNDFEQVQVLSRFFLNGWYTRTADMRRGANTYWSPTSVRLGNRLYMICDEAGAYLINDTRMYHCGLPARPNGHYTTTVSADPDGVIISTPDIYPSMMFSSFSKSGRLKTRSGYCYSNMYLATINNLENSVEKTNTMSMRIEYTLTVI